MKRVLVALLFVLPASRIKNVLLGRIPGFSIDITARISPCLVLDVARFRMGARSRVALGSVFQNLARVDIAEQSSIGRSNWISSSRILLDAATLPTAGTLVVGRHSAITSRHHIDCSGGILVGAFSTLAGHGSTVLTHSIDVMRSAQTIRPVVIGDYCFIGSNCTLTAGTDIADRVVVGAGSVTIHSLDEPESLYAGVPATRRKSLSGALYFSRMSGPVLPA